MSRSKSQKVTSDPRWFAPTFHQYCDASKENAQICLGQIAEKYPDLMICKPLQESKRKATLVDGSHLFHPDVAGLILNKEETHVVGITNNEGDVTRVEPKIEIPDAAMDQGNDTQFHIGDLPVVVPDSKESQKDLKQAVKESDLVVADHVHQQITDELKRTATLNIANEPPSVPTEIPRPYLIQTASGTVPIIPNPAVPIAPPLLAPALPSTKPKTSKSKTKPLPAPAAPTSPTDDLLAQIRNRQFQLKKVPDDAKANKGSSKSNGAFNSNLADAVAKRSASIRKAVSSSDSEDSFDDGEDTDDSDS